MKSIIETGSSCLQQPLALDFGLKQAACELADHTALLILHRVLPSLFRPSSCGLIQRSHVFALDSGRT